MTEFDLPTTIEYLQENVELSQSLEKMTVTVNTERLMRLLRHVREHEVTYDDVLTDAVFRSTPEGLTPQENRARVIQSNDVAEIVIGVHHKCFGDDVYVDLGLRYGIADALYAAGYRKVEGGLPLDPEPWVIKSIELGDFRVSSDNPYLGYRHNFEPREGYSQDRTLYKEVNDGRG